MLYPLLLSILAAVPVTPAQDPDPTIRISLNSDGQYLPGDRAKVQVIARDDGYLMVFQVSPEGRLRVLFPLDPTDDAYVKGGKRYLLLGRGGREGFVVDAPGSGAVFAAVSLDPWQFTGFVQNDHWDYAALNRTAFEDPENQLVNLAQGMAAGRFDYDILGYTVASMVASTADAAVSGGVGGGFYDACYTCDAGSTTVIVNTGYTFGLYDPWYYSPYNYYGPYYPAWSYPGWGWGGYYGGYYPYYPTYYPGYPGYYPGYPGYYPPAIPYTPYSPYTQKSWDRRWNGEPVPYRPRTSTAGYTATNTVAGQLPGIGVTQRAGFRDRTWAGSSTFAPPSPSSTTVPVSKAANTSGGRRSDPRPTTTGGASTRPVVSKPSTDGSATKAPTRTRNSTWATPGTSSSSLQPEARPSRPESQRVPVLVGPSISGGERRSPATTTSVSEAGTIPVLRYAPGQSVGPEQPASGAVAAPRPATSGEQKSEPVLRRRESEKPAASAPAPAPRQDAPRQDNGGQARSPDRSSGGGGAFSRPPQASPPPSSGGWGGGGGGGGQPASGAVAGGGRRR